MRTPYYLNKCACIVGSKISTKIILSGDQWVLSPLYIETTCLAEDCVTIWGMDGGHSPQAVPLKYALCTTWTKQKGVYVQCRDCGKFMLGLFMAIRLPIETDAVLCSSGHNLYSPLRSCWIGFRFVVFFCILYFYRTQVSLGSDLWVLM